MSQEIGGYIRRVLEEKKLTQKELSEKSGLSESTLSRLISGERGVRPSLGTFIKLAKGLDVPVQRLMDKSGWVYSDLLDKVNNSTVLQNDHKFSKRLYSLIKEYGTGIEELSAKTSISISKIEDFLASTKSPSELELSKLAVFFEVSSEFLSGKEEPETVVEIKCPEARMIARELNSMNKEGIEKLKAVLEIVNDNKRNS